MVVYFIRIIFAKDTLNLGLQIKSCVCFKFRDFPANLPFNRINRQRVDKVLENVDDVVLSGWSVPDGLSECVWCVRFGSNGWEQIGISSKLGHWRASSKFANAVAHGSDFDRFGTLEDSGSGGELRWMWLDAGMATVASAGVGEDGGDGSELAGDAQGRGSW